MKVKYLKPHNGKSPGDKAELDAGLGKYLVAMGVVSEEEDKKEVDEDKPKRGRKPKQD